MAIDFRIKSYFRPSIISGVSSNLGWKDAWEVASLNITGGSDTIPETHQYIIGQNYASGRRAPVASIQIQKHFVHGSHCDLVIKSPSDRDFFDVVPNETGTITPVSGISNANPCVVTTPGSHGLHSGDFIRITGCVGMTELNDRSFKILEINSTSFSLREPDSPFANVNSTSYGTYTSGAVVYSNAGDMLPRISFPYRAWEVNLKGKDTAYPTTPMFRGMLTGVHSVIMGDKRIANAQDKLYNWIVSLASLDAWNLRRDKGVALWYQRANHQLDDYHLNFNTDHTITFNQAITKIVAWMNQGSPTKDFPFTYTYSEVASSPYNLPLNTLTHSLTQVLTENQDASTWTILSSLLYQMGAIEGLGKTYLPQLSINQAGDTATITVALGGFDKTQPAYEDFTTHEAMLADADTTTTIDFTKIHIVYTNPAISEYWRKFTLYKWNGSSWDTELTVPATGHEYIPYDANDTHSSVDYHFKKKKAGRYKWHLDLIKPTTSPDFAVNSVEGYCATAPAYIIRKSQSEIDFTHINTFAMTRGACSQVGTTECPDFVAGQCAGAIGLYPDPIYSAGAVRTGVVTFTPGSTQVTGYLSNFTTELVAGDLIKSAYSSVYNTIASIESDVSLTLEQPHYDPKYETPLVGLAFKMETPSSNEGVHPVYGILSSGVVDFADTSDNGDWDTNCRLNSKRLTECSVDSDSTIRKPVGVTLEFVDGWTEDLVGKYCEYYEPALDADIVFRVMQQTHTFTNRLNTVIEGFRI